MEARRSRRPGIKSAENSLKWKNAPLDRFPTAEARKFVDLWTAQLKQIEFGRIGVRATGITLSTNNGSTE